MYIYLLFACNLLRNSMYNAHVHVHINVEYIHVRTCSLCMHMYHWKLSIRMSVNYVYRTLWWSYHYRTLPMKCTSWCWSAGMKTTSSVPPLLSLNPRLRNYSSQTGIYVHTYTVCFYHRQWVTIQKYHFLICWSIVIVLHETVSYGIYMSTLWMISTVRSRLPKSPRPTCTPHLLPPAPLTTTQWTSG